MANEFFIIHKSILPDFYNLVIRARDLVENEGYSVSAACQNVNISRSTYYKYKECIFNPSKEFGRKAILAFKTHDEMGVLSNILNVAYENKCSVISINQGIPIKNNAYITLTLDLQKYDESLEDLIAKFKSIKYVKTVSITAVD